MLDSDEAARRLGVKLPTLYAYVSRGLLASHPSPSGRRSLFAAEDVEALAQRARGGRRVETRLATVTTGITQLREDGPAYRGTPAVSLAGSTRWEDVAALLWRSDPGPWEPMDLRPPGGLAAHDRLRWTAVMAGAADPLRSDLRPEAVARAARRLIATMVAGLASDGPGTSDRPATPAIAAGWGDTVAGRLAATLAATDTAGRPRHDPARAEAVTPVIDAALVLLADHELATSTVAVRVAASTRADVYDAVLAGLGTLGGPLHGGAGEMALALLADAQQRGVEPALDRALRWRPVPPGFGHPVYRDGDPRAAVLFELAEPVCDPTAWATVRRLRRAAEAQGLAAANIDLALAALVHGAGLAPDASQTLFAVARTAGWVAHYLEELGERPLRFRARAVYAMDGGAA